MREFLGSFYKLEFDKIKRHIQRYSISEIGKEHIDRLSPLASLQEIQFHLSLVTEMKRLLELDEPLPLNHVLDIRETLQRSSIENFALQADSLHAIALVLQTSADIIRYFAKRKDAYQLLAEEVKSLYFDKVLLFNITQAIDENGSIKDSASKELSSIRRQIIAATDQLKHNLESILRNVGEKGWTQEDIVTTRDGRMVIPVKVEHKNQVPGFIHSASASGATVFIEPTETLELNNSIRTLQFQEQREIERILRLLTEQVRNAREEMSASVKVLGFLDFLQAKARYSIEIIGSEPRLTSEAKISLHQAFHPILLQRLQRDQITPLDLELGSSFKVLIITGPNAGGKSVAMKTVGLLALIVQSGCHIPVNSESEMGVFSEIFVDMGDEQSIENDLSSFSSHLRNLKIILEESTASSLVLIDEIASGTDPTEGASLAAAVLEQLAAKNCLTIVTTHHGALKTFAFEHPLIENGGMEFDQQTLKPTYRFHAGIPGSSYALEMAERMALPHDVIARSHELKGTESVKLESLLLDLERKSQELTSNLEAANTEKSRFESLATQYQQRMKSLEKETKAIRTRAVDEARSIVQQANSTVERAVREIRQQAASAEAIRSAREQVRDLTGKLREMHKQEIPVEEPLTKAFAVGDTVRLKGSTTTGEIADVTDNGDFIIVAGSLRFKAPGKELEYSKEDKRKPLSTNVFISESKAKSSLDVRGMYGDEAIQAIEKFIDDAVISGLQRLDVIHGKGTGALRRKITEYLRTNSNVKSFRLGEWNEGGAGVTILEISK